MSMAEWAREFFSRPEVVKAIEQKAKDIAIIEEMEKQFEEE